MLAPHDLLNPEHYSSVRLPAAQATPLPNWCYTSPEFYRLEVEKIFMKAWKYVGHTSQIPNPGDYSTHDITGALIIVVRGEDAVVRAFHNACPHRGAPVAQGEVMRNASPARTIPGLTPTTGVCSLRL